MHRGKSLAKSTLNWQLTAWVCRTQLRRPWVLNSDIEFERRWMGSLDDLALMSIVWSWPGNHGIAMCESVIGHLGSLLCASLWNCFLYFRFLPSSLSPSPSPPPSLFSVDTHAHIWRDVARMCTHALFLHIESCKCYCIYYVSISISMLVREWVGGIDAVLRASETWHQCNIQCHVIRLIRLTWLGVPH